MANRRKKRMSDDYEDLAALIREIDEMRRQYLPATRLENGYEIMKILEETPEDEKE